MRKILVVGMVLALVLLVIPVGASAGLKVDLCHLNGSNGTWVDANGAPWHFGRLISVSVDSWSKHGDHGDAWYSPGNPNWYGFFVDGDDGWDDLLAAGAGEYMRNANCAFSLGVPEP